MSYSSQGGAGTLGWGWSVSGVSAISRGPKTRVVDNAIHGVDFSDDDQFYLDGQRLILVSGTHGQPGAEYRTEIDSFTRVVCYGRQGNGPARFRAWTKAGLIIEYGPSPEDTSGATDSAFCPYDPSTAKNGTEVQTWSVSRIYDTSGNYMAFSYYNNKDAKSGDLDQRIKQIDYTGHGSDGTPYATVYFDYESRSDTRTAYIAGRYVANNKRLSGIRSTVGGTTAREYLFHYTTRQYTNRSLLTSIEEKGTYEADGVTRRSFPQLTFDYGQPGSGWSGNSTFTPPDLVGAYNANVGSGLMDLDGDGRPDFIRAQYDSSNNLLARGAWLNTVGGWVPADGTSGHPDYRPPMGLGLAVDTRPDSGWRFADIDGDGKPDVIFSYAHDGATDRFAYKNTPTGWQPADGSVSDIPDWRLPSDAPVGVKSVNDAGGRFVDINGDGLVDYVWSNNTNRGCYLNNADGRVQSGGTQWIRDDRWAPPLNLTIGTMFVDVNGDGLPDQIQSWYGSGATYYGAAINTGDTSGSTVWKTYANYGPWDMTSHPELAAYVPPVYLNTGTNGNNNSPVGTEIADLNGDGLPDLLWHNSYLGTAGSALNTGKGWVTNNAWNPQIDLSFNNNATGTALLDVNGDGIVDLIQSYAGSTRLTYIGTGSGWAPTTDTNLNVPRQLTQDGKRLTTGTDMVDINGDGVVDEVWNWVDNNAAGNSSGCMVNNNYCPDRLLKVTTGLGVSATITYKPMTDSSVYLKETSLDGIDASELPKVTNVVGPMYVVSSVDNDDGVGGQYRVSYDYIGMRAHRDRGSLGFESMESVDSRTSIKTVTTFAQNYPFIGLPTDSYTSHTDANGHVVKLSETTTDYAQKAITGGTIFVFATEVDQSSYDLVSAEHQTSDGTYAPLVAQSKTLFYDPSQLDPATGNPDTKSGYDNYGNSLYVSVDSGEGYKKVTQSTYDNTTTTPAETAPGGSSSTQWFLGRLRTSTVTSTGPSIRSGIPTSIVRNSSFQYDSTTGLLTNETVEPNASDQSQTLSTTYGYDKWGNKTSVTASGLGLAGDNKASGSRTTTSDYAAFNGRFPAWTKNGLGHPEAYTYDLVLGNVLSLTGPNGLTTKWQYDGFGRKIQEDRPDTDGVTRQDAAAGSALSRTAITYGWAAGTGMPPNAMYYIMTETSGSVPSTVFYDKMGRSVGSYTISGPTRTGPNAGYRVIGTQVRYDSFGRTYKSSLPFFLGDTPMTASYVTQYDDLGRPVTSIASVDGVAGNLVALDGADSSYSSNACYASTTYDYNGLTTTVAATRYRGENGALGVTAEQKTIRTQSTKNMQGWVLGTIRNSDAAVGANDRSDTAFLYDPLGELCVTQVRGTSGFIDTTVLTYDLSGRKATMVDASMGSWSYGYNSAGELISQADPKKRQVTIQYDVLGRMTKRTEPAGVTGDPDIITTWTYDSATHSSTSAFPTVQNLSYTTPNVWVGKLSSLSVSGDRSRTYSESYTYTTAGRPESVSRSILAVAHTTTLRYDSYGRPVLTIYPGSGTGAGYAVRNVLDTYGFVLEVRDGRDQPNLALGTPLLLNEIDPGFIYWQSEDYTIWGVGSATLGNGVTTFRSYSPSTGRVTGIDTGLGYTSANIQQHRYAYDSFGNVASRVDNATGRKETFQFDALDRITNSTVVGATQVTVQYDPLGNITSKSDNGGTYTYSDSAHPYQLTTANGHTYSYDELGAITADGQRSYTYASSGAMQKIQKGSTTSEFWFGAGHERVIQQKSDGTTIVYVGGIMEMTLRTSDNSVEEVRYFVMTPQGRTAVRTENALSAHIETRWLHEDTLGSVIAQTNEWGEVEHLFTYDAWGKQSIQRLITQPTSSSTPNSPIAANPTNRGYTDHEMLTDLGLVHMNGRVYDPTLGRCLSPDPVVSNTGNGQDHNGYSYVGNNPLGGVDPSGFAKVSLRQAAIMVAVVVISVVTYGAAAAWAFTAGTLASGTTAATAATGVLASSVAAGTITASTASILASAIGGAAAGFASGFAGSLLNGQGVGQAFRAGAIGGLIGGIAAGAGAYAIRNLPSDLQFLDKTSLTEGMTEGFVRGSTEGALNTIPYGGNVGKSMLRYGLEDAAAAGAMDTAKSIWRDIQMPGMIENGVHKQLVELEKTDPQAAENFRNSILKASKADAVAPGAALAGAAVGAVVGYTVGRNETSAMAGALIGGAIGYESSGIFVRARARTFEKPLGGGFEARASGAPMVFGILIKSQAFTFDVSAFSSGWTFSGSFKALDTYDPSVPFYGIWRGFGNPRQIDPHYSLPPSR